MRITDKRLGSKSLSEECPVCQHSPLDGSECKPNKSLRMTVKAYVKSEEKKRSVKTAAVVESVETPAPTVDSTPAPVFEEEATELAPVDQASPVPETTTVETVQGVEGEDPEQEVSRVAKTRASNQLIFLSLTISSRLWKLKMPNKRLLSKLTTRTRKMKTMTMTWSLQQNAQKRSHRNQPSARATRT